MSMVAHPPVSARLADGRWHFQHGPIDLILDVHGASDACEAAIAACWERFCTLLPELVGELGALRRPASEHPRVSGKVAGRMVNACAPFAGERFLTPMAAVAGAVADELIGHCRCPGITRASINNGGDIALHLAAGELARVGICVDPRRFGGRRNPILDGRFTVEAGMPVRGIATSGCRGRSLSLGIADSVTVLASTAAAADAAATLIANAVNSDYPGIVRAPATQVKDDSDLGTRLVTMHVPALPSKVRAAALDSGRIEAEHWQARGLIHTAALFLQGEALVVLPPMPAPRVSSPLELSAGHACA